MANIGVRSPYFVNYTSDDNTAESSKIELSIASFGVALVLRYTIIKNTGVTVRLDISELVRDYIQPTFTGVITSASLGRVAVSIAVSFFDDINATGTVVDTDSDTFTAYDGYGYFSEGSNFELPSGALLSGNTIYAAENTSGSFYAMGGDGTLGIVVYGTSATGVVSGVTIKRYFCSKYTPIKSVFINKFGVHQEFYFFTKTTESFVSTGDQYKSNIIANDGTYDVRRHQVVDFNKNGKVNYTLNTGFVGEEVNPYVQELMLSEQVWLLIDGSVVPVRPLTSSVQYRTSLNDKMVSYTVDFEEANDIISSVR